MHKGVRSLLDLEIGDLPAAAVPECFRTVGHLDSLERQAVYLAKGFGRIDEPMGLVASRRGDDIVL